MAYRPHRSANQWQQLIDRQIRSSQSAREFCADHNIGYASFIQWRSRLTPSASSNGMSLDSAPEFVDLRAGRATPSRAEEARRCHTDSDRTRSRWWSSVADITRRLSDAFLRSERSGLAPLCTESVDMRKSYNGLSALVKHRLSEDPLSGHLHVFVNRRRTQMKILCFDRNGYAIWSKRLEQGQFVVHCDGGIKRQINFAQLQCLLEGIELENTQKYNRFSLPE